MSHPVPATVASHAARHVEEVAPGVLRIDSWLPFRGLRQVNLWLLRDGDGWTMIDCGFGCDQVREHLSAVWSEVLDGRPLTRLIVTHFHPDHMGNCRWISQRFGLRPWMSTPEWMAAQLAQRDLHTDDVPSSSRFYARHGMSADVIDRYAREFILYSTCVELPDAYRSFAPGEEVVIGGRIWRVIQGGGHSPALVGLYCPEIGVYIAGDQILPKITPNISVVHWDPFGDPLRAYFASLEAIKAAIPDDVLVLPSHRLPFRGLHDRISELRGHHDDRLDKIRGLFAEQASLTGAQCMQALFGADLDGQQIYFAMGEALAHLNHLCTLGEVEVADGPQGAYVYRAKARL